MSLSNSHTLPPIPSMAGGTFRLEIQIMIESKCKNTKKLSSVDEIQTNKATSDMNLQDEFAETRGGGEPRRWKQLGGRRGMAPLRRGWRGRVGAGSRSSWYEGWVGEREGRMPLSMGAKGSV